MLMVEKVRLVFPLLYLYLWCFCSLPNHTYRGRIIFLKFLWMDNAIPITHPAFLCQGCAGFPLLHSFLFRLIVICQVLHPFIFIYISMILPNVLPFSPVCFFRLLQICVNRIPRYLEKNIWYEKVACIWMYDTGTKSPPTPLTVLLVSCVDNPEPPQKRGWVQPPLYLKTCLSDVLTEVFVGLFVHRAGTTSLL